MKQQILIFLIVILSGIGADGKVILPSVFSDNMVLQQRSDVAIWGWADAGETLRIVCSWNSTDTLKVKTDNTAAWRTSVKTRDAGGPYTISILGSSNILLRNVMLGEVWVCSGQSNMEWSVNYGIMVSQDDVDKADNPNIRIFHIQKTGADYPQNTCEASWTVSSPETMRSTSAIGYFFARALEQKLQVPIGIIVTAWGGTPAEVWMERSLVENDPELNRVRYKTDSEYWPDKPGVLYNSMIWPMMPYGIAGAIWYQGESNCSNHQVYARLMKNLIENWREGFKKEFPFYLVQIAPFDYGKGGTSEFLREQQEMVTRTVPKTGMVVVSDLVDNIKDIHPKNKIDVGKRLANYALAETYGQDVGVYKSPSFASMKVEKNKVRVYFDNAPAGLKCTSKAPSKFLVAGEDGNFVPATAKIEGSSVVLSAKAVKVPVAVRFCFDDTSTPDVFSAEGLPLAPFRTDHWSN